MYSPRAMDEEEDGEDARRKRGRERGRGKEVGGKREGV